MFIVEILENKNLNNNKTPKEENRSLIILPLWVFTPNKSKNLCKWDFHGGPMLKSLPSSAGNVGSTPGRGTRIPHAAGQLSPHTATTEPALLN